KGEARLNGYYSQTDYTSGAEVQGALAVSKNIGVMLNTAFLDGGRDGNGYLLEGGAGYYKPFAEKWVFESYAGVGFGSANNNDSWEGTSKVNFTKCFVQPSVGYASKYFDAGVASRFSGVYMKVTDYQPEISSYNLEYVKAHPNSYLWEPSGFIAAGFQQAKLRLQMTYSLNLNNKELSQEDLIVALGVSFNIKPKNK
ncbi:MAG TPA: hypothetical protein VFP87_01080, partial [Chitinophagaceae bacterium]|nr:hypothetical protein [Chitinophagaceae bacterium]